MSCGNGCAERAAMLRTAQQEFVNGKPIDAAKTVGQTAKHMVQNPPDIKKAVASVIPRVNFNLGSLK